MSENRKWYIKGLRAGIPIGLGYMAVAFTLGIAAKNAGLTPWQAMLASLLCNASAGEYVGFTMIAAQASYIEVAIMELVANARYLLMSFALSQKLRPNEKLIHRIGIGWYVTDEVFGVGISAPGRLNPFYSYGAITLACPGWAIGTFVGVIVGNVLPDSLVSALSVGLYGMFIAIFVPAARKSVFVLCLMIITMAASWGMSYIPQISSGIKIIIVTVVISAAAAIIRPVKREENE